VIEDRETGRSRGFAFVEMATPEKQQQLSRLSMAKTLADAI
jgi:L-ribulose-5-phosphate 3-epimerase UlaE